MKPLKNYKYRILAMIMAIALIVTGLPGTGMAVYATDNAVSDETVLPDTPVDENNIANDIETTFSEDEVGGDSQNTQSQTVVDTLTENEIVDDTQVIISESESRSSETLPQEESENTEPIGEENQEIESGTELETTDITEELIIENEGETASETEDNEVPIEELTPAEFDAVNENFQNWSWEKGVFRFKPAKTGLYLVRLEKVNDENDPDFIGYVNYVIEKADLGFTYANDFQYDIMENLKLGESADLRVRYKYISATFDYSRYLYVDSNGNEIDISSDTIMEDASLTDIWSITVASEQLPIPSGIQWVGKSVIWNPVEADDTIVSYDIQLYESYENEEGEIIDSYITEYSGSITNINDVSTGFGKFDFEAYTVGTKELYAIVRATSNDITRYMPSNFSEKVIYDPNAKSGMYRLYDITSEKNIVEGYDLVDWIDILDWFKENESSISSKEYEIEQVLQAYNEPITEIPTGAKSITFSAKTEYIYINIKDVILPCDIVFKDMVNNFTRECSYDLNGHNLTMTGQTNMRSKITDSGEENRGTLNLRGNVKPYLYLYQMGGLDIDSIDNVIIDINDDVPSMITTIDNVKNITLESPLFVPVYNKNSDGFRYSVDNIVCNNGGELLLYEGLANDSYRFVINESANIKINKIKTDANSPLTYIVLETPFPNGKKLFEYSGDISNIKYSEASGITKSNPDAGFSLSNGYVIAMNNPKVKNLFEGIVSLDSYLEIEVEDHYEMVNEQYKEDGYAKITPILSTEYFTDEEGCLYYPYLKEVTDSGYSDWGNEFFSVDQLKSNLLIYPDKSKLGTKTIGVAIDYEKDGDGNYIIECTKVTEEDKDDISFETITLAPNEVNEDALNRVFPITISVKGRYTEKEKSDLLDSIKFDRTGDSNQAAKDGIIAYLIGNGNRKLSEVKLNKDGIAELNDKVQGTFTWVNQDQVLNADANVSGYNCTLKFTPSPEGDYAEYGSFTCNGFVAVTKLTGVSLSFEAGKTVLDSEIKDDSVTLCANYNATGYFDEEDTPFMDALKEYETEANIQLTWKDMSGKNYVSMETANSNTKKQKITLNKDNLEYKNGFANKIQVTLTDEAGKKYTASQSLTLVKGAVTAIKISEYKENEKKVNTFINENNAPELSGDNGEYSFSTISSAIIKGNVNDNNKQVAASVTLSAEALVGENPNETTKLTWTSSDTSIATVKASDKLGRKAVITFSNKASGDAVITVKSSDKGGNASTIFVYGEDNSPIQYDTKINLNAYFNDTNPLVLPIKAQEGTTIENIEFVDTKKYANYKIENHENEWIIKTPAKESGDFPAKKLTDKAFTLKVTVKNNDITEEYNLKFTLTVAVDKPTATVKQTVKPNIFYTDTVAEYTVTSKTEIESVKVYSVSDDASVEIESGKCQITTSTDGKTVKVTISDRDLAVNKTKVYFEISYKGYNSEIKTTTKSAAIGTTNKKPAVSLVQADVPTGVKEAETGILVDKKSYELKENDQIDYVSGNVTVEKTDSGLVKIKNETGKAQSYKANIQLENWSNPVTVSGKFAIIKQPVLVLGNPKINMNIANNYQDNGYIEIPVSLKNSTFDIAGITYDTSAAKNAKIFEEKVIKFVYNKAEQKLKIGFDKESAIYSDLINRAGTYSIPFTAQTKYGDTKPVNLSLTVNKKAITVAVSLKGSLNTVDRENGPAISFKIANASTGATVKDIVLKNSKINGDFAETGNADLFYVKKGAQSENPAASIPASIAADWNSALDIKQTYKMGAIITLSDGTVIEQDGVTKGQIISIKPVQKLPKVTLSKKSFNVYKKSIEDTHIEVTPAFGTVENMYRQYNDKNYSDMAVKFTKETDDAKAFITVSPDEIIKSRKAGKYTVTLKYTLKGQAVNTAPQTVKVTAAVMDIKVLNGSVVVDTN